MPKETLKERKIYRILSDVNTKVWDSFHGDIYSKSTTHMEMKLVV